MGNGKLDANIERLAHKVIGCAIEVHRELGPGFLESVYEEALCIELASNNIPFKRQFETGIKYKSQIVGKGGIDILVADKIVVELKTVERFEPIHMAQIISYLKTTQCQLGLLMNYNVTILKHGIKRLILT